MIPIRFSPIVPILGFLILQGLFAAAGFSTTETPTEIPTAVVAVPTFTPTPMLTPTATPIPTPPVLPTVNYDDPLLYRGFPHPKDILSVAYAPDGKTIATGCRNNTAILWEIESGKPKFTLTGHTGQINTVDYSPDNSKILTAGTDKTVKIWDFQSGKEIYTFTGHTGGVNCAVFSPDGKSVLSGGMDKQALWWELETRKILHTFQFIIIYLNRVSPVYTVAFSNDGTEILTGGPYFAAAWNLKTGTIINDWTFEQDKLVGSSLFGVGRIGGRGPPTPLGFIALMPIRQSLQ